MEKIPRARSHWKIDHSEGFQFRLKYCFYFNEIFSEFGNEIKQKIFPLYLKLFGQHSEIDYVLSSTRYPESYDILKKDYVSLSFSAKYRSNQSKESIKPYCVKFIDKSHEIFDKYRLISDDYEFDANRWLVHSFYCSIVSGTPRLMMSPELIYPKFSKELMTELWEDLPINQKEKVLEETIQYFEKERDRESYHEFYGKYFENWDVYFNSHYSPLFFPPPFSFDFDSYNIWEDLKQYEERAVEAYRQHIKSYLQKIQRTLKNHGFKRNKKEDYEQVKWLVLWNKYDYEELSDIVPIIGDYCGIYVSYDAVRKAFNKFKKYDLPIRPYGKKRKNLMPLEAQNVSG